MFAVWAVGNHRDGELSWKAALTAATAVGEREGCVAGASGRALESAWGCGTRAGGLQQTAIGAGGGTGPWATAHLLHAAPGDRGQGVGHEARAQAPEQPYLPVHLHDVLGCKEAKGTVSRPARDTRCRTTHPDRLFPNPC